METTETTETRPEIDEATYMYEAIKTYLEGGQSSEVRDILKVPENRVKLKVIAWDLVSLFTLYIDRFTYEEIQGVYEVSLEGIKLLVEIGKPKEILLVLLEQADTFNDDTKYINLLSPIQTCLLKMEEKKYLSLGIAMETLYAHILSLEIPSYDVEGEERKLLDSDPKIKRVCEITSTFISFLEPFCDEVKDLKGTKKELSNKVVMELTRFLLRLLEQPLVRLDVIKDEDLSEGPCYVTALDVMTLFSKVQVNVHTCVQRVENENVLIRKSREGVGTNDGCDYSLVDPYSDLGLSMYLYLSYSQGMAQDTIPQVYTPLYVYEFCHKYALYLIRCEPSIVIHKGLTLLKSTIGRLSSQSVDYDYVESLYIKDTVSVISQIAISSSDQNCRKIAIQLLPNLLDKFNMKGRNKFLKYLINCTPHGGIVGYAIHMLKEEIDSSLSLCIPCEYFMGQPLCDLLRCVFSLPDGATTDILDQRDRILAALNLLRFLLLRDDRRSNITGFWNIVEEIEKSYCDPLRTGINMSKGHYQMEIRNVKEGCDVPKEGSEFSLTVGGVRMPSLSKEQQEEVLETGLISLDMIESVLGRVCELISTK